MVTPRKRIHLDRDTVRLANAFRDLIRGELNKDALIQIDAENRGQADAGTCATHDYLDPNELMLEAWGIVMPVRFRADSDLHIAIIEEAWLRAKRFGFASLGTIN